MELNAAAISKWWNKLLKFLLFWNKIVKCYERVLTFKKSPRASLSCPFSNLNNRKLLEVAFILWSSGTTFHAISLERVQNASRDAKMQFARQYSEQESCSRQDHKSKCENCQLSCRRASSVTQGAVNHTYKAHVPPERYIPCTVQKAHLLQHGLAWN